MSQEYTEDRHVTLRRLGSARRLLEALLIIVALFACWLLAALISFNPSDPGWSQTAWHEPIHNMAGLAGAWLADILLFVFGLMAYPLPLLILSGCWFGWRYRSDDGYYIDYFAVALRLIGALALMVTSCGLAAMNADDIWYFASGGVIGSLTGTALAPWLNVSESTIALLCVWAAGLTLFTGWSWVAIVEKIGGILFYLLTFASNRTRGTIHPVDSSLADSQQKTPQQSVSDQQPATPKIRMLRGALLRRQNLAKKFTTPVQIHSDKALFSGQRMDVNMQQQAQTADADDVLFSAHRITGALTAGTRLQQPSGNAQPQSPSLAAEILTSELVTQPLSPVDVVVSPAQTGVADSVMHQALAGGQQTEAQSAAVNESLLHQESLNGGQIHITDDGQATSITAPLTSVSRSQIKPAEEPQYPRPNPVDIPRQRERAFYGMHTVPLDQESQTQQDEALSCNSKESMAATDSMAMAEDREQELTVQSADSLPLASFSGVSAGVQFTPADTDVSDDPPVAIKSPPESLIHPLLMRNGDNRPLVKPDTPLPSLDLLTSPPVEIEPVDNFALEQMARLVEARLADFRIQADVVNYLPGPVITRFELNLAPGVKAARISSLARDLARSLSAMAVRVVEVIPGKPYVGLELPNKKRQTVYLREVLDCQHFRDSTSPLSVVLGKDISGEPVVADLAKMPHLLVAGTTGSGKSVGVNAMILSMLYKATPDEVRFIMIDPKMLELSVYEGIPHLLTEVVTDMKDAANALRWSVGEMERRYKLMSALGVRNLNGYNDKINQAQAMGRPIPDPYWKPGDSMDVSHPVLEKLPYIVVLVDEFADLMMTVGKKVEELIARLAQKARAAGIHLVLATQRPSVDVITGLIKANIPTRIAFTVSSKIDSRTILDQGGAESLLGMGDMLYAGPASNMPVRVHGAFVRDQEVHAVVQDWKARGRPQYIDGITSETDSDAGAGPETGEILDPLFDQAVAFVVEKRKASISGVQRQFRIGYNRAARIVEQMEMQGIVSEAGHNGNREVLAPPPFN